MPWLTILAVAATVPLVIIISLLIGIRMWKRGVAQGRAEAVEMLDTSIGLLDKKVQELAVLKDAGAPSDFQRKTAEEVSEWAESVVRLWKTLRQQPR